ncbi:toprim domain-containing protein [Nitratireductor aquimarinus]|uniref:DUF7146 domain-containing protein n=1 Tax=Nitratireductor aquimarinus TaxID=889300 RepID=UPI001A8D245E|nr:toprim domain-containing protein [Nitratireductor aquimarinus]MBN8245243.1 toprim domain-containing protein [Nitratireductor aquimarinus]MBY6133628.1 toprim domain-containing protein [Nitratireductor aquimarinus]MCA1304721.1 toprim domain-containing protein [Nitratireductor aquimarinus]
MTSTLKQIANTLGGSISGGRIRCPAPGKGRSNRSLSILFSADGTFHVTDFSGGDWRVARDYVKSKLGLSDGAPVTLNDNIPAIDPERLKRRHDALSVWGRSRRIAGTLAETYLRSRGLSYDGDALRFWRGGRAMVALITNAITGEPQGIHRTFLDRDGKCMSKRMLGTAKDGVVRLSGDDSVTSGVAIAEGIETALAVPFRPVWACLSAGQLAAFPVLPGIESLTIFADNDASGTGQSAANECGQRWHDAGREVTIVAPAKAGLDFADREVA